MFKERFLVFKSPEGGELVGSKKVEAPAAKISKEGEAKRPAFDPKGERAEASAEFAEKLAENDSAVYEKAIKLLETLGVKTDECDAILEDDTNPYIPMFLDFIERMDQFKFSLDEKFVKKGWLFRMAGGLVGTPDFVVKTLRWRDVIRPRLKESLGSFYSDDLMRIVVLHDLYGMKNLVDNLNYSARPQAGYLRWAKWEISQIVSGVDVGDIVKKEKEIFAKHEKADIDVNAVDGMENPEYELPDDEDVKSKVDEEVMEKKKQDELIGRERTKLFIEDEKKFLDLSNRFRDPREMTTDDYETFQSDCDDLLDGIAKKSPKVAEFDERIRNVLEEYETLIAAGYTGSELEKLEKEGMVSSDDDAIVDMEKAINDARNSGDYATVAALSFYHEAICEKVDPMFAYYGTEN